MTVTDSNIINLETKYDIRSIESELRGFVYFIDPQCKSDGIVICRNRRGQTHKVQIKLKELKKFLKELNGIYEVYFG